MEFEKKTKIMEKSWNFKISIWKNHGKNFGAPRIPSNPNTLFRLL